MNLRTQYLKRNACYIAGKAINPIGVMVHSTSADNPHVSRYVPGAAVYREAEELVSMLCRKFGLDPLQDGVVICHAEGCQRGVASNHGDVLHWFPPSQQDYGRRHH